MLLTNLLEAETDSEYRLAATTLQLHMLPPEDSIYQKYECVHPDWFDGNASTPIQVDSKTCMLCAYRQFCTLGRTDGREHVEIIPLDDSNMPSKEILQEHCFSAFDSNGNMKIIDPFRGFTSKAGRTRKLYLISQSEFSARYPDSLNDSAFDAAIGYDWELQQAIWPIDQLFLEKYERSRVFLQFEIIGAGQLKKGNLSSLDQACLYEIASQRGWLKSTDSEEFREGLHLLLSRFVEVLKHKKLARRFEKLANMPMVPNIDHPFSCSGSGFLHLAIRWIELKPGDLDIYLEKSLEKFEQEMQDKVAQRLRVPPSQNFVNSSIRYRPRFPMICITSESELSEIKLEQPAGRIIDVVVSNGITNMLLIDSLGIDLKIDDWR